MTNKTPEADGKKPAKVPVLPGALPETQLINPLDADTRTLVSRWLNDHANHFEAELSQAPPEAELREMGGEAAAWAKRHREGIAHLRDTAAKLGEDTLAFSVATEARNFLEAAEQPKLVGACAALERAITAALPVRRGLLDELIEQRKQQRGFHIIIVGGQGEPLPMPSFAYTEGLVERAAHPELAIVGIDQRTATVVLSGLAEEVVAGKLQLAAGEQIAGQLQGGYELQMIECPAALAAQLPNRDRSGPDPLQVLVPDVNGRFPGDPDVDPSFERAQQYPDYSG